MSFGIIIRNLRRERDLTQEELAEILSISPQAVSRWETDAAMPDISLLSTLCNYFNISADVLLGIDLEKKKERISSIREEAGKYSSRGYYEKSRELLKAGLREYPDSYALINDLMYLAFWQYNIKKEKTAYRDEAIRLGEAILDKSTDDDMRLCAKQILCYTYRDAGKKDEAIKLARSMPCIAFSSEILESSVCNGNEGYEAKQSEAGTLFEFLSNSLSSLQTKLDLGEYAYTEEELAALRDKRIALIYLFFENGDFGFYHCHLWDTHFEQAKYYIRKGDNEKALSNLQSAAEHAIGFVTSNADSYTSLVFRGKARGSWVGSYSENDAVQLLKKLDDTIFDGFNETSEFAEIKAKLNTYADKWQVR